MKRRTAARAAGFSLLEVIVALVVISGFGASLFVWAGQTLQTATRAAVVQQQAEIERNVTELVYAINPGQHPSGELQTANHRYAWQATPIQGPLDQLRYPAGISPYQVGLYKVRVTVSDLDSKADPEVIERISAGYAQVRPRNTGPPGIGINIAPP
ncbi:MAG: type II secretion system protein [Burkholderiales bacterium]|nr:type II secretion system GspH family protein [Burkholderiales bacterium]MDE1925904.1 type II secretion system protein [Burkholderiales bacterium]MDE2157421.1 type II secretion system protein [Burkholderiales bacterium]MDE2502982.1 type II secretion system protein [Burkholderiales bacterium]